MSTEVIVNPVGTGLKAQISSNVSRSDSLTLDKLLGEFIDPRLSITSNETRVIIHPEDMTIFPYLFDDACVKLYGSLVHVGKVFAKRLSSFENRNSFSAGLSLNASVLKDSLAMYADDSRACEKRMSERHVSYSRESVERINEFFSKLADFDTVSFRYGFRVFRSGEKDKSNVFIIENAKSFRDIFYSGINNGFKKKVTEIYRYLFELVTNVEKAASNDVDSNFLECEPTFVSLKKFISRMSYMSTYTPLISVGECKIFDSGLNSVEQKLYDAAIREYKVISPCKDADSFCSGFNEVGENTYFWFNDLKGSTHTAKYFSKDGSIEVYKD